MKLLLAIIAIAVLLGVPVLSGCNNSAPAPPKEGAPGKGNGDGGSISGHVYQADGVTPVAEANVSVALMDRGYQSKSGITQIPAAMLATYAIRQAFVRKSELSPVYATLPEPVITDRDGRYTYAELPAGEYLVTVQAVGFISEFHDGVYYFGGHPFSMVKGFDVIRAQDLNMIRLDDYPEKRGATVISIAENSEVKGVDFTLVPGASISGFVYQANGTPANDVRVMFSDLTDSNNWLSLSEFHGSFAGTGLQGSTYHVQAWWNTLFAPLSDNGVATAAQIIDVATGEHIQDVIFTLPPNGSITGEVTFKRQGIPEVQIVVEPTSGEHATTYNATTYLWGRFSARRLPPGDYRVRYRYDSGTKVYSGYYRGGTSPENATVVKVGLDEDTPIDIVIKDPE